MIYKHYLTIFLALAVLSLAAVGEYHFLPANAVFELLFLIGFMFVAKRMCWSAWTIFAISVGYFLACIVIAKVRGIHLGDFLIAFKGFFYLSLLPFFSSKALFPQSLIKKLWYSMLILFFFKYVIWIGLGHGFRPGIFTENNFEIMFLLCLGCAVWGGDKKLSLFDWASLGIVVFLSGSRSGVICFLAMITFLYIKEMNWKAWLKLGLIGVVAAGVVAIFISRLAGGDLESIDRVVFFQGFLIGIQDWGLKEFLFGSPILTPLPEEVCNRLKFYESLFSAANPNICYSVILHSYLPRTVFDHGLVGLFFIFYSIYHLLKLSDVHRRARLSVLAILILNGVSVSSVNSIYAVMGLVVVMTTIYPWRVKAQTLQLK